MFHFTIILLPSIDDIIKFFTELRTNPVDSIIFIISKIIDLVVRAVMHFYPMVRAILRGFFIVLPTDLIAGYYKAKEYGLKVTPNVMHCYNKKRRFLVFLEMWLVFFFFWKLLRATAVAYIYVVLKGITFALPLVSLSSIDRMPFWYVAIFVYVVDVAVVRLLIYYSCYGRNWKEVSRYKRITPNRQFVFESTWAMYFVCKTLSFLSYYCYNAATAAWRFKHPHQPVQGGFIPGTEYFRALVEADTASNLRYGLLLILAVSSLTVYSIILAGWSSNSKYAFIGALRSAAQMISYEVAISLILLPVILLSGSLNLAKIVTAQALTTWFFFPLLPIGGLFLIAMLAETNRTPFDLPEAEAELVAGYNVDYSALPFAMFFLGEYCNMILISVLFCVLFLGGWTVTLSASHALLLSVKAAFIWIFFVIVRATLPRYRYDQLMDIGWKTFLPVTGGFLIFVVGLVVAFYAAPVVHELPQLNLFAVRGAIDTKVQYYFELLTQLLSLLDFIFNIVAPTIRWRFDSASS